MIRQDIVILNVMGLHARAAAHFVQMASRYRSHIQVSRDARTADGKSILGLLSLIGRQGTHLILSVDGPDEIEAAQALTELVATRFGEPQ